MTYTKFIKYVFSYMAIVSLLFCVVFYVVIWSNSPNANKTDKSRTPDIVAQASDRVAKLDHLALPVEREFTIGIQIGGMDELGRLFSMGVDTGFAIEVRSITAFTYAYFLVRVESRLSEQDTARELRNLGFIRSCEVNSDFVPEKGPGK